MASTEDDANKVPGSASATVKQVQILRDDEESTSSKTATAATTETKTTTTTKGKITADSAIINNSSISTTMAMKDIAKKPAATTTIAVETSAARTATEVTDTGTGTIDLEDGNSNEKRKALGDESSSSKTLTQAAPIPTTTTIQETNDNVTKNISNHTENSNGAADADAEAPPTKKRGRERPRQSEQAPGSPRKRTHNSDKNNTNTNNKDGQGERKIVFYAIRRGGPFIETPIIFFGLKEFDFFYKCINRKVLESGGVVGAAPSLVYRVCDTLADALAYADGTNDPASSGSRRTSNRRSRSGTTTAANTTNTTTSPSSKRRKLDPLEVTQQQGEVSRRQPERPATPVAPTVLKQRIDTKHQRQVVAANVVAAKTTQQQQRVVAVQATAVAAMASNKKKPAATKKMNQRQQQAIKTATPTTNNAPIPAFRRPLKIANAPQKKVPPAVIIAQQQHQRTAIRRLQLIEPRPLQPIAPKPVVAATTQQQTTVTGNQEQVAAANAVATKTTQQQQQQQMVETAAADTATMASNDKEPAALKKVNKQPKQPAKATTPTSKAPNPVLGQPVHDESDSRKKVPTAALAAEQLQQQQQKMTLRTSAATIAANAEIAAANAAALAAAAKISHWEKQFELLRQYKQEFGHCDVRCDFRKVSIYRNLGPWVTIQREQLDLFLRNSTSSRLKLTTDQRRRLVDLGFIIDVEEFRWNQKFDLLQEFKLVYKHCNVAKASRKEILPEKFEPLVFWTRTQKQLIEAFDENEDQSAIVKRTIMTEGRRKRLVDLGLRIRKTKQQRLEAKRQANSSVGEPAATTEENTDTTAFALKAAPIQEAKPPTTQAVRQRMWQARFEMLRQYKQEFGHCDVRAPGSKYPKYQGLQQWVNSQREQLYIFLEHPTSPSLKLNADQRDRLIALEFIMNVKDFQWNQRFELLREYKEEHGHCDIFQASQQKTLVDKYYPLMRWGEKQRRLIRKFDKELDRSRLSTETIVIAEHRKRLVDLGFPLFKTKQQRLEASMHRPATTTAGGASGAVVAMEAGDDLGLAPKPKRVNLAPMPATTTTDQAITDAVAMEPGEELALAPKPKQVNLAPLPDTTPTANANASLVATNTADEAALAVKQKQAVLVPLPAATTAGEANAAITVMKAAAEAAWAAKKRDWEQQFQLLQEYKQEHGHCEVQLLSSLEPKYKSLVSWVNTQREQLKMFLKDHTSSNLDLTSVQRDRLTNLGFIINVEEFRWNQHFALMREYKKDHGDCNFLKGTEQQHLSEKYRCLVPWGRKQQQLILDFDENGRTFSKESIMTAERRERLVYLGLPILLTRQQRLAAEKAKQDELLKIEIEKRRAIQREWEEGFELLRQYKQDYGNCDFRSQIGTEPKYNSLGPWVYTQREQMKLYVERPTSRKLKLTADQRQRLMDLGFIVYVEEFRWNQKFDLLREYKEEFGDCDVRLQSSSKPELIEKYKNLQPWVKTQRKQLELRSGDPFNSRLKLTPDQRDRLVDLGFIVNVEDYRWNQKFDSLRQYKKEYGNCIVGLVSSGSPEDKEKYKNLQKWVKAQREQLKLFVKDPNDPNLMLTQGQRDRLMDLGFVVDVEDFQWNQKFDLLCQYKEEYGNCTAALPSSAGPECREKYKTLQPWVRTQREQLKLCDKDPNDPNLKLTQGQRDRLMDLGFLINTGDFQWNQKFDLLRQYKEEYGDCVVALVSSARPKSKEKYKTLQPWARTQREQLKLFLKDPTDPNLKLTPDQRDRLMDVGFVVDVEEFRWNQKFELLRKYKEEHGDCDVGSRNSSEPAFIEKYKSLWVWVRTQREQMKLFLEDPTNSKLKLTPNQACRLTGLGFIVDVEEFRWNQKFALLREYKEEHGDFNIFQIREPPQLIGKYEPLILWGKKQQQLIKNFDNNKNTASMSMTTTMTAERRQRLVDLGFPITAVAAASKKNIYVISETQNSHWEERFELLRQYKEEYGNCDVFRGKDEQPLEEKYKPLDNWIKRQKHLLKKIHENGHSTAETLILTAERRQRLVDLGIPTHDVGDIRYERAFQKRIEELKAYKEEHGTNVLPGASRLREWLTGKRREYAALQAGKPSRLKLKHIMALDKLGYSMVKDHTERKTLEERIMDYVEFVKKNEREPDSRSKDPEEAVLGTAATNWRTKRKRYKEGITVSKGTSTFIPQHLIDALDAVNFRWKVMERTKQPKPGPKIPWEVKFELLKKYKEKHGHCEPPHRHPKLGRFVHNCQQNYKYMVANRKSNLTVERFRKLSEIGFTFKTVPGYKRKGRTDSDSSGYDTTSDNDEGGVGHAKGDKGENGQEGDGENDQPRGGAVSNRNNRNGQWVPDDCMWL